MSTDTKKQTCHQKGKPEKIVFVLRSRWSKPIHICGLGETILYNAESSENTAPYCSFPFFLYWLLPEIQNKKNSIECAAFSDLSALINFADHLHLYYWRLVYKDFHGLWQHCMLLNLFRSTLMHVFSRLLTTILLLTWIVSLHQHPLHNLWLHV